MPISLHARSEFFSIFPFLAICFAHHFRHTLERGLSWYYTHGIFTLRHNTDRGNIWFWFAREHYLQAPLELALESPNFRCLVTVFLN